MDWAQICGSSSLSQIHLQILNIFFVKSFPPFFMSSAGMPSIPTPLVFLNFAIAHSTSDSKTSASFIAIVTDKEQATERWAQYCEELYPDNHSQDESVINELANISTPIASYQVLLILKQFSRNYAKKS